ncbi:MAG: protein phosphatase 2C domain-containing protein [Agathobacter sp.]|nr:protein phosphatase 2C domain-containing protein [Agathobacter sp.]
MENRGCLNAAVKSDVGLKRHNNEDNYILGHCLNIDGTNESDSYMSSSVEEWMCCGVFDGMGGADYGELASLRAAECFQEAFLTDTSGYDEDEISEMVENTFNNANKMVCSLGKDGSICGTTGTVVVTNGNRFRVFHVGDSRAYLLRGNDLFLLTKDQTVAQMKIDIGVYQDKSQVKEKENHQLTEFIGCEVDGNILIPLESSWRELLVGDKILICSDGLYDMCSDRQLFDIFKMKLEVEKLAQQFVNGALSGGGNDNITVLVLERV